MRSGSKERRQKMPDLTIEIYFRCTSNDGFSVQIPSSKAGEEYTVRFGRMPPNHECQYDWTCTCKAFKFGKGKPCKHIKEVDNNREKHGFCGWHQFMDGGEPVEGKGMEYFCPRCGMLAKGERWGV
jgi:hypothetical protein